MASKLAGANDFEKLKSLCLKTYKEQAVWFLNGFWDDFAANEAEKLWSYVHCIQKLDLQKGAEGCEVDELNAHRFLENFKETMTVREMRDTLRETGAIVGNMKMVPLTHYLLFRYKADWHALVHSAQGDNSKEIEKAQKMLDEVQRAFQEAESKASAAKTALREAESKEAEAKKREADAKASEAEAKKRESDAKAKAVESKTKEAEAKAAQEELEKALKDLHEQEDAYKKKTEELTTRSEDESTGVVQRNKAKNELSQHLAKDPLPLSRAKITQEAAVKKADKAAQAASDARKAAESSATQATAARAAAEQDARDAEKARSAAEKSRHEAEVAKEAAERAAEEMAEKVQEAEAYLNEVKNQPGCAHGSIFWLERELHEAKAYMPEKKGGYRKN
jgi:DNA polymerase III gamma/tau subunit